MKIAFVLIITSFFLVNNISLAQYHSKIILGAGYTLSGPNGPIQNIQFEPDRVHGINISMGLKLSINSELSIDYRKNTLAPTWGVGFNDYPESFILPTLGTFANVYSQENSINISYLFHFKPTAIIHPIFRLSIGGVLMDHINRIGKRRIWSYQNENVPQFVMQNLKNIFPNTIGLNTTLSFGGEFKITNHIISRCFFNFQTPITSLKTFDFCTLGYDKNEIYDLSFSKSNYNLSTISISILYQIF